MEPREAVPVDRAQTERFTHDFQRVRREIAKVVVGNDEIVDGVLVALLAGGHVLLEGVPGLGKTLLVRTLSQVLDLKYSRVQFTPDLMPADISGTTIFVEDAETGRRRFQFAPGPIFANLVLADEINRATPKTQSALLEAMQEQTVTVGGVQHELVSPFFVLATQNPIEMEGTYPLPEAQMDRFLFKLLVRRPTLNDLSSIVDRTTGTHPTEIGKILSADDLLDMRALSRKIPIAPLVRDFAARVILATSPGDENAPGEVAKYVRFGASPRGAQALVLAAKVRALLDGRFNVANDDIRAVALPALRHRIILNFEGEAEGVSPDSVVLKVVESVTARTAVKAPV